MTARFVALSFLVASELTATLHVITMVAIKTSPLPYLVHVAYLLVHKPIHLPTADS